MKNAAKVLAVLILFAVAGCETVHQGTKQVGSVIGEGANALGGLTEGGAEAVQGEETKAENPYGR